MWDGSFFHSPISLHASPLLRLICGLIAGWPIYPAVRDFVWKVETLWLFGTDVGWIEAPRSLPTWVVDVGTTRCDALGGGSQKLKIRSRGLIVQNESMDRNCWIVVALCVVGLRRLWKYIGKKWRPDRLRHCDPGQKFGNSDASDPRAFAVSGASP